jgi:hypothetical protein
LTLEGRYGEYLVRHVKRSIANDLKSASDIEQMLKEVEGILNNPLCVFMLKIAGQHGRFKLKRDVLSKLSNSRLEKHKRRFIERVKEWLNSPS